MIQLPCIVIWIAPNINQHKQLQKIFPANSPLKRPDLKDVLLGRSALNPWWISIGVQNHMRISESKLSSTIKWECAYDIMTCAPWLHVCMSVHTCMLFVKPWPLLAGWPCPYLQVQIVQSIFGDWLAIWHWDSLVLRHYRNKSLLRDWLTFRYNQ